MAACCAKGPKDNGNASHDLPVAGWTCVRFGDALDKVVRVTHDCALHEAPRSEVLLVINREGRAMDLRVTDLMIDAAKSKPKKKCDKTYPPGCLPHTDGRCTTCTGITQDTKHFTTRDQCAPGKNNLAAFDEMSVIEELLSQLRVTLNEPYERRRPEVRNFACQPIGAA